MCHNENQYFAMFEWISRTFSSLAASISVDNPVGLIAILLLTASADIGLPFPFVLDTLLFLTAYQEGPFSLPVFLIVSMLLVGRFIGSGLLYWLSRLLGTKFLSWAENRFPRFTRNIERIEQKLGKRPILTLVAARLTPGLMQVSSVSAGALRFRFLKLILAILVSSIIYDGTLITLGFLARLGLSWIDPKYSVWIVFGFLVLLVVVFSLINLAGKGKWRQGEGSNS